MITEIDAKCRSEKRKLTLGGEWVVIKAPPAPMMFDNELGVSMLPARGLLWSMLVHGLFTLTFLFAPWSHWLPAGVHLAPPQFLTQEHAVLLLPKLEPMGSDGAGALVSNGESNKKEEDLASSYDAKAIQGVVYKGPQVIVSNSSHPDNFIQTIRQPDLVRQPKLPAPLPLPPMVSLAPAKPIFAPRPPQPAPDVAHENLPVQVVASNPILLPQEQPRVDAPKLPLPEINSTEALLHAVANAAVPATMPGQAHQHPSAKTGTDAHNILVVDAISRPDPKPHVILAGELYGTFTVSPAGATSIGLAGGGTESKGAPGLANASGNGVSPYAGNGSKSPGHTGEDKQVRAAAVPGSGTGHGSAESGHGSSMTGGKETGNGTRATGRASGHGGGLGAGSGSSPFPSIMIQGGIGSSSRSIARTPVTTASKPQTSYGITILAGGGGGGFKDFGVFRNEASYTVYVDMTDTGAEGSSWTMQYALDSNHAPGSSDPAPHSRGSLVPPYATSKSLPHFSAAAARKGHGGTMVVFGVINLQGKLEDLRVMQSPEPGLNRLLLDSLKKWTFQPAGMDGAQVPVKVLLGVPVDSVPGE